MNHWSHRAWSVTTGLALAASLVAGGSLAQAQSPAASDAASASPAPTCTPLPTFAGSTVYAPSPGASPVALTDLTVFAAASLNKPFSVMGQSWAAQNPGSELTFSFDASSALRAQIEEGAPVDVFASADIKNPQALIDECLAPAPMFVFATNHLVIVVPAANPAGIASAADLGTTGVRIVAAGDEVPITKYAEQLISNIAAQAGAPAGYADAVHANIVSREDNVSAVLAKVALGEGDAGIVYVSDATGADGVTAIQVPDDVNVLATYGAVEIATTSTPDTSAAFLFYLMGAEGQAILATYGFLPAQ
ncbi:MAG: molybdate ABC transporter substrate-binding protein [Chloroflexi bacterium]|nr:molybdate ABC transporter substrate-binding protein [Chloroflexota bacterium]